jgi:hypothetical protein
MEATVITPVELEKTRCIYCCKKHDICISFVIFSLFILLLFIAVIVGVILEYYWITYTAIGIFFIFYICFGLAT